MTQIGRNHNETLPSEQKLERLVSLLDAMDLPDLLTCISVAASSADMTGRPTWVVRQGISLRVTDEPPETSHGHRSGARYLLKMPPRSDRLVSTERALALISEHYGVSTKVAAAHAQK